MKCTSLKSLAASLGLAASLQGAPAYPWLQGKAPLPSIESRIPPPDGFERRPASGFAGWLRKLPLKPGHPKVKLHNGRLKDNQSAHAAVVDIDAGKGDLQQCADAVMRLRAEYLFSIGDFNSIHFEISKKPYPFNGGANYPALIKYLRHVYAWAGSASLSQELKPVSHSKDIEAGDVIIKGGYPGHAVLVADVCVSLFSGEKAFLLVQSYMPAQDIQVLRNPVWGSGDPWYIAPFEWPLITPEWTFPKNSLKRFP